MFYVVAEVAELADALDSKCKRQHSKKADYRINNAKKLFWQFAQKRLNTTQKRFTGCGTTARLCSKRPESVIIQTGCSWRPVILGTNGSHRSGRPLCHLEAMNNRNAAYQQKRPGQRCVTLPRLCCCCGSGFGSFPVLALP
jgi:hypothetical protein